MSLLVLSVAALFVGTAIYPILRKFPASLSFFDAFSLISIIGLTLMHLIPHSVENAGLSGLIAVFVGLAIPALVHFIQPDHNHSHHEISHKDKADHLDDDHEIDHHDHHSHKHKNILLLAILFIGVIVHTLLDGIGLSMASEHSDVGQMMGLGVLFHRLPISIFLSLMLVPRIGLKKTWLVVIGLALSTTIGFTLGHFALPAAGLTILYVVQGLIAGSLLHVIFHNVALEGKSNSHISEGTGALAGLITLALIEIFNPESGHEHASVLMTWAEHIFTTAPFWIGASALMGGCYALSHVKKHSIHAFGKKLCNFFDPQPSPALYGGSLHIFSISGIALFLAVTSTFDISLLWFVPACIALTIAWFIIKPLHCCRSCCPESLCNREKSYKLWLVSSWTLFAVSTLLMAVLPEILEPLSDIIDGSFISTTVAEIVIGAGILCLAFIKRGITPAFIPLGLFTTLCLFHECNNQFILAAIFTIGTLLVFLYDFHPRDIATSLEQPVTWKPRFVCALLICAALSFGSTVTAIPVLDEPSDYLSIVLEEHEHKPEQPGDHADIDHENNHQHNHDERLSLQNTIAELHDSHTGNLPNLIPLALFALFGLMLLLSMGPRHLFETAAEKHHHKHE